VNNGSLIFSFVVKGSFEFRESGGTLFQHLSLFYKAKPLDWIMQPAVGLLGIQ